MQLVREGAGDRLGLVTFSSTATTPQPPIAAAAAKPALVGPAPFTTGLIGGISVGGSTSIGKGLQVALAAYGGGSTNDRAMLLMTDGLQNTPPFISDVEGSLGPAKLNVIGLGRTRTLTAHSSTGSRTTTTATSRGRWTVSRCGSFRSQPSETSSRAAP